MKTIRFFISILLLALSQELLAQAFTHPGILHGRDDLERMKAAVAAKAQPIFAGYELFLQNPASQYTYKMQGPLEMVGRNPTVGQGTYDSDANAAHQNALLWAITGDRRYADKAREIVNAWSATLKSITGRDAVLMAGLGPFKMVNAAELLRHTGAGWPEAEVQQTEKHFKEVIYPVLQNFAPFANGNWDAAAIKTVMAIGVFCNDRDIFERALRYYVNGHGNGRLTHYILNEDGQIQESGRDQGHTQLGIGMLAECSEIAWKQGLDLYGYADNRLLKGFEYVAKFNLGSEVPFVETLDRTGKYHHKTIARQDRGPLRAVYEQVYNHYVKRKGLSAPYTQQAAEKLRPEGPGRPGADHPGYGTLFFTRPVDDQKIISIPPTPGGLIATGSPKEIRLSWIASATAARYTVKRATHSGGPYTTVARDLSASHFTDKGVKRGVVYYYTVAAANAGGESGNAVEATQCAGLPQHWQQQDIGSVTAGHTQFDGRQWTLTGSGGGVDSTRDGFHFTGLPLVGDGTLTVRFVPQPGSQFSRMGLMLREGGSDSAPFVSLLLYPGKTGQVEAPDWHVRLLARRKPGAPAAAAFTGPGLAEPAVTFGRLTGYFWLRLQRKGKDVSAFTSYDGRTWTPAGSVTAFLGKSLRAGLAVASGMPNPTTVFFDQFSINGKAVAANLEMPAAPNRSQAWVADQGNGTYTNPVLYADYSDPDIIRVGDDYFMTASSFHCMPGLPILHSRDLVNWRILNYALQKQVPSDFFDVPRHGYGVWAPALRYHKGTYYIFWGDPDHGIYRVKTKNPAGKWEEPVLVKGGRGLIDPCPLWDADGKAYLVHAWAASRAGVNSLLTVYQMSPDGARLLDEGKNVFSGHDFHHTTEGPKLYQRDGYYYIMAPAGGVATGWQLVLRSQNIYGPYEDRIVMDQGSTNINGPHQGAYVETPGGEPWFLHFQDLGAYGRVLHLQPVTWKDGWPVMGTDKDGDGKGEPVRTHQKPRVGRPYPVATPQESDEFNSDTLGLQWQWQANPKVTWSALLREKGFLRLFAFPLPKEAVNLWPVPNLLLQKFPAPSFTATTKVKLNIEWDVWESKKAGLLVMGNDYAYLSVSKNEKGFSVSQITCSDALNGGEEEVLAAQPIGGSTVYLRVEVKAPDATCRFSYSEDGQTFRPLGKPFTAKPDKWVGAKLGLFCTSRPDVRTGSYADFDWFRISR
ncbi:family 43 glycosylhydrolase [Paraflavisolibacter sp. H34]|uniref:family 43 glycosylhydrolase n=1 Tax=Huijunlia imazamoxiresistens TaxID=3127457 RepID=UPI003015EEC1